MKIQILTSQNSWLNLNKRKLLINTLKKFSKNISIINDFKKINKNTELCIILSYYKIIPQNYLKFAKHNLVVHESDLPKGKGFSPLYWQILKGKSKVIFTLFEAAKSMDSGKFYFKKKFNFKKTLLFDEIKELQIQYSLRLISIFIKKYKHKKFIKLYDQRGKSSFYKARNKESSKLNPKKSIELQMDLLRICDNNKYPAFFFYKGKKFNIKVDKDD
jgi:methionyl-tRNA formyltransferase